MGCQKIVTKTLQFQHTLMRNDIYIHFNQPKMWSNENSIVTPEFTFVPDSFFSVKDVQYFLEVDRLQKMKHNLEKLNHYKRFKEMNLWQKRNGGRFPIVLFYTDKESRKHQLSSLNPGIELQVYTKEDLH